MLRARSLLLMFCAGIVVALVLTGNPSDVGESSATSANEVVDTTGERSTASASPQLGAAPQGRAEESLAPEPFAPQGIRADDERASARTDRALPTSSLDGDGGGRNGATRIPLDGRVRLRDEMVALHEKLENETETAWGQTKEAELFNYLMSKRELAGQYGVYDGFSVECRETVCEIQVRGIGTDPFAAWNRATADIGARFPEFVEFMQGGAFLNPAGTEAALVMIGERKAEASTLSAGGTGARA